MKLTGESYTKVGDNDGKDVGWFVGSWEGEILGADVVGALKKSNPDDIVEGGELFPLPTEKEYEFEVSFCISKYFP